MGALARLRACLPQAGWQRLRWLHLAMAVAHAAMIGATALVAAEYPETRLPLRVTGRLSLWLTTRGAQSFERTPGASLPGYESFAAFRAAQNTSSPQFLCLEGGAHAEQCREASGETDRCGLHGATVVSSLRSELHSVDIMGSFEGAGPLSYLNGYCGMYLAYFACSALHHACVFAFFGRYEACVRASMAWGPRWLEYAASAGLMSLIVTVANGDSSPESVYQTVTLTAVTMFCGYALEVADGARCRALATAREWPRQPAAAGAPPSPLPALRAAAGRLRGLAACAFVCAAATQLFGLWLHPWILRYARAMEELRMNNNAIFTPGLCRQGPPPFVGVAVVVTVFWYSAFAVVAGWRLRRTWALAPDTRREDEQQWLAVALAAETAYAYLSLLAKVSLAGALLYGLTQRVECGTL
jgi:hypothetical protein